MQADIIAREIPEATASLVQRHMSLKRGVRKHLGYTNLMAPSAKLTLLHGAAGHLKARHHLRAAE